MLRPPAPLAVRLRPCIMDTVALPADGHVHSEWSWDARDGAMEQRARARRGTGIAGSRIHGTRRCHQMGCPCRRSGPERSPQSLRRERRAGDPTTPERQGYLESVQRCRDMFPQLTIPTLSTEFRSAGRRTPGTVRVRPEVGLTGERRDVPRIVLGSGPPGREAPSKPGSHSTSTQRRPHR
jgi:hypothetical protein